MSRIEELPDDSNERLKVDESPKLAATGSPSVPFPIKPTATQDGPTAQPPPQMQSVRSHTADEIVQMMNKTPLFMTSLDNADEEDNPELEAIRALQYEGTPLENAQSFKEQGNDMVKVKEWKDGQEFYTKALLILQKSRLDRKGKLQETTGVEGEVQNERQLEEICLVNRALCNLELKNYRSTTLDCATALRYNPKNVKAFYRSSKALLALDKVSEALDSCNHGLALDPTNVPLKTLATAIETRAKDVAAVQQKKQKQAEYDHKVKLTLSTALRARNIRTRTTAQPPELEDATIHLAPDPVAPTSTIHFPLIILYPLHAQSDFIKAFPETDTIAQHLEYIFPLPWDGDHEYEMAGVEFYMETAVGGLVKVGRKMSLLKALSGGDVEVVDGLVKVNVVPKAKAGVWIEEMKARKGK